MLMLTMTARLFDEIEAFVTLHVPAHLACLSVGSEFFDHPGLVVAGDLRL